MQLNKVFTDLSDAEQARLIPLSPILIAYRGSHAHGTYIPPEEETGYDDVDIITCYIPSIEHYLGIEGAVWRGSDTKIGKWDAASYELRHYAHLLAMGNPNVLSTLWTDKKHLILTTFEGEVLLKNRELFSSKLAHKSFCGYAYGQMKRMTAWKEKGLETPSCGCVGTFHSTECPVREETGRGTSKLYATGFMGEKRKNLVEKFGYDVKNAAHLLRLLAMGEEFLREGFLRVDRTGVDADFLKDVKTGKFELSSILKEAEELWRKIDVALEKSPLPEKPDKKKINDLIVGLIALFHNFNVSQLANATLVRENLIHAQQAS